jgi:hypothetical protein
MSESSLPEGFAELERFVADWSLGGESARNEKRLASSLAELREFYAAMIRHMEAILEHLSRLRVDDLPEPERRLFQLALSLMEVAPAVENYAAPDVPDAIAAHRFVIHGTGR